MSTKAQTSPVISAMTSPKLIANKTNGTMDFPDAMREVIAGKRISRQEWDNQQIVVYLDDLRQPDLESSLITVKVETIVEMRYLDQNRAVQNRGPGHEAGVIEVITTAKRR